MSNQQPPWNPRHRGPQDPRTGHPMQPVRPAPRRIFAMLAVAIFISVLAAVQWVLVAVMRNPSFYSVMVPGFETFAAAASWFSFIAARRAGRMPR